MRCTHQACQKAVLAHPGDDLLAAGINAAALPCQVRRDLVPSKRCPDPVEPDTQSSAEIGLKEPTSSDRYRSGRPGNGCRHACFHEGEGDKRGSASFPSQAENRHSPIFLSALCSARADLRPFRPCPRQCSDGDTPCRFSACHPVSPVSATPEGQARAFPSA